MKRVLSLIMILAMVLLVAPAVFAEGETVADGSSLDKAVAIDSIGYFTVTPTAANTAYYAAWTAPDNGGLNYFSVYPVYQLDENGDTVYDENDEPVLAEIDYTITVKNGDATLATLTDEASSYEAATDIAVNKGDVISFEVVSDQAVALDMGLYYLAEAGTKSNPIRYQGSDIVVTIEPGATVYYGGQNVDQMKIVIDNAEDLSLALDGVETPYTAVDGEITATIADGTHDYGTYYWNVTNNGEAAAEVTVSLQYVAGSAFKPVQMTMGDSNSIVQNVTVAEGSQSGYYYTWTAPADGVVTFTFDSIVDIAANDIVLHKGFEAQWAYSEESVALWVTDNNTGNWVPNEEVSFAVTKDEVIVIQVVARGVGEQWWNLSYPAVDANLVGSFATYVAKDSDDDEIANYYTSLDDALANIGEWGYIYLTDDVTYEGTFLLSHGSLYLEGHTLTVDNFVSLSGTQVADYSAEKTGRLVVNNNIALSEGNSQIPVLLDDGYLFAQMTMNQKVVAWEGDTIQFKMLPRFGKVGDTWVAIDALQSSFASTGLNIYFHLEWTNSAEGTSELNFQLPASLVESVYTNNELFTISVTGVENLEDLVIYSAVSSLGVGATGDSEYKPGTYNNPISMSDGDTITIAAGETVYYDVSSYVNYVMTLDNGATGENVTVSQVMPASADAEITIGSMGWRIPPLTITNNGEAAVTYTVSFEQPAGSTAETAIEVGTSAAVEQQIANTGAPVYFKYTATESGTLKVTMTDTYFPYSLQLQNETTGYQQEPILYAWGETETSLNVTEGDEILFIAYENYNPMLGGANGGWLVFDLTLTKNSETAPAPMVTDGKSYADVPANGSYYFTWTAEAAGTLTITLDSYDSENCYIAFGDGFVDVSGTDNVTSITVAEGDTVTIEVGDLEGVAGEVVFKASFADA